MSKKIKYLGLGAIGLVVLFFGLYLISPALFYKIKEKYIVGQYLREVKTLEDGYKKNTYGGDTPEETLALFIEALKSGDADLAGKYFVPEKEKEYREIVNNWKKNNKINDIVSIIENNQNVKINQDQAFITISEEGIAVITIILYKNKYSQKWLIESL